MNHNYYDTDDSEERQDDRLPIGAEESHTYLPPYFDIDSIEQHPDPLADPMVSDVNEENEPNSHYIDENLSCYTGVYQEFDAWMGAENEPTEDNAQDEMMVPESPKSDTGVSNSNDQVEQHRNASHQNSVGYSVHDPPHEQLPDNTNPSEE